MKKWLLIFLILLSSTWALEINEIMYNPLGSDNNHEFIELFLETPVNLSEYTFTDAISEDTLEALQIVESSYVLIVEEGFNYSGMNVSVYSTGATLGNNLGNSEDTVIIKDEVGKVVDQFSYTSSLGGNGNNRSICLFNETWQECISTPGKKNELELSIEEPSQEEQKSNLSLTIYLNEEIYLHQDYTNLFKIKINHKKCALKDNVTVAYRISKGNILIQEDQFTKEVGCSGYSATGKFSPILSGNYTLCGEVINSTLHETTETICQNFFVIDTSQILCNVSINIQTEEMKTYLEGNSIKFTPTLNDNSFPFIIEYWVEDLFGKIYKKKYNTSNTNQKSWQTHIEEEDRILLVKALVYPTCNDSNTTNNHDQKIFFVLNNNVKASTSLNIEKLYLGNDNKVEWGDQFTAKVNIFKGDESKYSVQLWAEKNGEKISKTTKLNLYDKYKNYPLTLPVQLEANCDNKIMDGTALLVLEAFGLREEIEFTIEEIDDDICKDYLDYITNLEKATRSRKSSYQLIDLPSEINSGNVLKIKIQLNGDDSVHDYKLWSYLYRGSKCYSCLENSIGKESNLQQIKLHQDEVKIVEFLLKVDVVEAGEYKLKVKLNKDGQKTNQEITETVVVQVLEELSTEEDDLDVSAVEGSMVDNEITFTRKRLSKNSEGIIVYESSSEKAKELIPFILAFTFILVTVVLIKKK
tara:strand:+ start:967 stop:3054 length:2088 start_codon:yes stop_codon:yes gene_type:complete